MDLNKMAAECHAANQHWWHDPATGAKLDRNIGELFMLIISEVAEAMEGERKSLQDDKLPHRPMAEVELADTLIRIFDLCGGFSIPLEDIEIIERHGDKLPENKGDALCEIVLVITGAREAWGTEGVPTVLSIAIGLIRAYAAKHGYDLEGAIAEKRAYNATRADHKTEARLAAGGKKW